jgi:hypothetical protein
MILLVTFGCNNAQIKQDKSCAVEDIERDNLSCQFSDNERLFGIYANLSYLDALKTTSSIAITDSIFKKDIVQFQCNSGGYFIALPFSLENILLDTALYRLNSNTVELIEKTSGKKFKFSKIDEISNDIVERENANFAINYMRCLWFSGIYECLNVVDAQKDTIYFDKNAKVRNFNEWTQYFLGSDYFYNDYIYLNNMQKTDYKYFVIRIKDNDIHLFETKEWDDIDDELQIEKLVYILKKLQ